MKIFYNMNMFKCTLKVSTKLTARRLRFIHYTCSQIIYIIIMLTVEKTDHTISGSFPYSL